MKRILGFRGIAAVRWELRAPITPAEKATNSRRFIDGRISKTIGACLFFRRSQEERRRGWDLNPRWSYPHSGFRDRPVQPLQHLSVAVVQVYRFFPANCRS